MKIISHRDLNFIRQCLDPHVKNHRALLIHRSSDNLAHRRTRKSSLEGWSYFRSFGYVVKDLHTCYLGQKMACHVGVPPSNEPDTSISSFLPVFVCGDRSPLKMISQQTLRLVAFSSAFVSERDSGSSFSSLLRCIFVRAP